jgi:hypothetical protein
MNLRSARTVAVNRADLRWRLTLAIVASVLSFTSCSERSQQLDERVTQLEKQLDKTETELQAANQSLKSAREELGRVKGQGSLREAPSETPSAITSASREALERSYTEKGKLLKHQLQEKLQAFTIGSCTLHNINIASPEYPVTSTMSLSIKSNSGNSFQLDVPAKADRTGNWSFPDSTEIAQQIEEIGKSLPGSRAGLGETSSGRGVSTAQQPVTGGEIGMPANRTAVIRWPESGPRSVQPSTSNASAPSSSEPAPAQKPQPGEAVGLSANRTVVIRWQDDGRSAPETRQPNSPRAGPSQPSGSKQKKTVADQDVLTQF